MRLNARVWLAASSLVLTGFQALAQDAPLSWGPSVPVAPIDAATVRDVITRQLSAFRHGEIERAYADAAPNVRRRFPTPGAFDTMARAGYQPLFRSDQSRFVAVRGAGATQTQAETWSQTVAILTRDGETWSAVYGLERQPDGSIKITSCVMVKTTDGAV